MRNKKGIASFAIIGFFLLFLLIIYIILLLPIPSFKLIRATVNLYTVITLWFLAQAVLVYVVYYAIVHLRKGFYLYRKYLLRFNINVHRLMFR